jgi:hypothetical protein
VTRSLLRCVRCGQTTGDVSTSRRDGGPRCYPCERRTDHERRLAHGERWYRAAIVAFAESRYGPAWEQEHGFAVCAELFADTRALLGWDGVGVIFE